MTVAEMLAECEALDAQYRAALEVAEALRYARNAAQDRHMAALNARPR